MPSYHTVALVVAGGRGLRTRQSVPKQYFPLGTVPMLRHTLLAFLNHPQIDAVCVVHHPDDTAYYAEATKELEILPPAMAGTTRQASVYSGLQHLKPYSPACVLIHDAARPFVGSEIITQIIQNIKPGQGVIPVVPLEDTLKQYHPDGKHVYTIDRNQIIRAQTPQGFVYSEILSAHIHARSLHTEMTDDAAVYESAMHQVITIPGSPNNMKITTPEDITIIQQLQSYLTTVETRTGSGFDVHAFCAPKEMAHNKIMLCGVPVLHPYSLKGHSDADVGLHALTDALLATISDGDIGEHFSDKNPAYRNMDSSVFLATARDRIIQKGGSIIHVDITIIGEAPKVSPQRMAMRQRVATILGISASRVSVKATTTEQLGFTGRKEGLAAQAIASVRFTATMADPPSEPPQP